VSEILYQYWPKNKPIPEGWVATMGLHETHHGRYSILIKRVEDAYKQPDLFIAQPASKPEQLRMGI
jgi:hypothetical protein